MKQKPSSAKKNKLNPNTKSKLFLEKQSQAYMNKHITYYPKINQPKPNSIEEKDLISEKELLIQERYQLKHSMNGLNNELSKYKTENVQLALQLSQREKELDDIISANPQQKEKIMQSIIISKLKAKYKEQSIELKQKEKEILELQQTKGYCNETELKIENAQLTHQLSNLAEIYKYSTTAIAHADLNDTEVNVLRNMITDQHCIIRVLEEKFNETERDNRQKKKEIQDIKQMFEGKNVSIQKLENDNKKLQSFIKRTIKDEVGKNEWVNEKKEYNKKIDELEKNVNYYKSLYVNNKDKTASNDINKPSIQIPIQPNQPIQAIQPIPNPEESTNKQILLFKSIIKELNDENKELKSIIKTNQDKHINNNTYTNININSTKNKIEKENISIDNNIEITFEDILLLNLSSKSINQSNAKLVFASIVNQESIEETSLEELMTNIANALSLMLDSSNNQKDKDALFNHFHALYSTNDIDDFCDNFYGFFNKVDEYLNHKDRRRETLMQEITNELSKQTDLINSLLKNFPQTINIQNMLSIFRKNGIKLTKEQFLFLCYEMKSVLTLDSLINKDCSMMNLKTEKLEEYINLGKAENNDNIIDDNDIDTIKKAMKQQQDIFQQKENELKAKIEELATLLEQKEDDFDEIRHQMDEDNNEEKDYSTNKVKQQEFE